MRLVILLRTALLCSLVLAFAIEARAQVSSREARRQITRLPEFQLPSSAVRVKRVLGDRSSSEVTAAIETAFRLEKNESGDWQVREFRTGPDRWEEIAIIARSLTQDFQPPLCDAPEFRASANVGDPSARRARCLLGGLLGIETPSDAVRVRDISSLNLPFVSQPSALVVAIVDADFRFVRQGNRWQLEAMRTGNRNWIQLSELVATVSEVKRQKALEELEAVAASLELYRKEHGFYVSAVDQAALIDHLSPVYLDTVVRLDPWHQPYLYQGSHQHFTLRSLGADGRENTPDDIVVSNRVP